MEHKLINTGDYLLIVDETEIKEGDAVYYTIYGEDENEVPDTEPFRIGVDIVRDINSLGNLEFEMESLIALPKECKKIIAHLPLNSSPILEGVDLLPSFKDDVEKLARQFAIDESYGKISGDLFKGFMFGYNKAKEKYKYTEEDVIKIVEKSRETGLTAEYLMLSLQQPKMPVGFKCEMETTSYADDACASDGGYYTKRYSVIEPKTIINSQGLTQLVGEYIY